MSGTTNPILAIVPYLLIALGTYMTWSGAREWIVGVRQARGTNGRLLVMVMGFRQAIVGLALIGFGFWLLTRETWILVLVVAVVAEEVFESGTIIKALRADPRLRERDDASEPAREQGRPAS